ncbi:hypothetical protein J3F83DRAFT_6584 [Trichoderma novae-zelandiae]
MSDRQPQHQVPMERTRDRRRWKGLPQATSSASGSRRREPKTIPASIEAKETNPGNGDGNTGKGKLIAPFKALFGAAAKLAEEEASRQRWLERLEAGRAAFQARYLGQNKPQGAGLNEEATQCSISELSQLMEDISLEDEGLLEPEPADERDKGKKNEEDWVVVQEDFDVLVFLDDG